MLPRALISTVATGLVLVGAGCGEPLSNVGEDGDEERAPVWLDLREVDEEPPLMLSEIGLYDDAATRDAVHPLAVEFEPRWPLWSNGLHKTRWLVLPKGEAVETDGDDWTMPTGTLLFKTFEDDDGPVETRVMWRAADGWTWHAYVWDDEYLDAERTEGRRSVDVEVRLGAETFTHKVPNELDCRKCHEPDHDGVLGFEPLQLEEQVEALDVFAEPPAARSVAHVDAATRDVLGWFVGNCTSCHNGRDDHDQASFDLRPDVALDNIIDRETETSGTIDGIRVVPGDPASSVLYLAVSGESDERELKEMPPLGVQRRDEEGISKLRDWIEGL